MAGEGLIDKYLETLNEGDWTDYYSKAAFKVKTKWNSDNWLLLRFETELPHNIKKVYSLITDL